VDSDLLIPPIAIPYKAELPATDEVWDENDLVDEEKPKGELVGKIFICRLFSYDLNSPQYPLSNQLFKLCNNSIGMLIALDEYTQLHIQIHGVVSQIRA
jgi:hypothetical protein